MSYLRTHSLKVLSAVLAIWLAGGSYPYALAAQVTESPGADKATAQALSDTELAALAGKLTAEERMALLARLSDGQVRELLIQQLDKAAIARADDGMSMTAHLLGDMQSKGQLIRENLRNTLGELKNLPTVFPFAFEKLTAGRGKNHLFWVVLGMAVMFALGAAAEWLFRRATAGVRQQFEQVQTEQLLTKFVYLGLRVVLDLLAITVFALAAIGVFFILWQGHEPTRIAVTTYLAAVMIIRLSTLASRFLFAPAAPALRLVPLDDASARYVHNGVLWFAILASFGFLTCGLMQLLGLDESLHQLLLLMVTAVVTATLVVMIWHGRHGVADLIRGTAADGSMAGQAQRIFADVWHLLAIAYVIAVAGSATIAALAGQRVGVSVAIASILVAVAVPLIDSAIGRALASFFATRQRVIGATEPQNVYEPILRRGLRFVLVLIALVVLARLWGINIFSMAETGIGVRATRAVLDIGLTLLVAYVGWQITKAVIDRRLAPEAGEDAGQATGGEPGGQGLSRVQTLLPLFRRFLQITIVIMVSMIVLSSLGVNIGPLIAGAGVVGLAIGFGAQTLVRDIVSGVFFLVDDAFRLGEYVDIGSVKGQVEKINVRSLVLRHHRGPLHTVPFGEIQHLTNYSRDWAIMKLAFRVTYDTDVNKVKKIFKQIGAELLAHEELGPFFIEPLKSQGVFAMEDSAMIVRAKFTVKPGTQFQIRKEVYTRVQEAFRKNGIEFAHRRVMVDLPPDVDANSPHGKALADAAAAATLTNPTEPPAGGKAPA